MNQSLLHYNSITDLQNCIDFRNSMKNNCFWFIFCYDIKQTLKRIEIYKKKQYLELQFGMLHIITMFLTFILTYQN